MIRVVICGYMCSSTLEKCILSVIGNSTKPASVIVSIDRDIGGDWRLSEMIAKKYTPIIEYSVCNGRRYLLGNTVEVLTGKRWEGDVVALVDADDTIEKGALRVVENIYRDYPDTAVTHGTYRKVSDGKCGKFNGAYTRGESFRRSKWRGGHLKTFKYDLWKLIPHSELQDGRGIYYRYCADRAMMIPLMEMAGHSRVHYNSTPIYWYNDRNPIRVPLVARAEQKAIAKIISKRKPLPVV